MLARIKSKVGSTLLSLRQQIFERDEQKIIDDLGHRKFIGKEYEQEGQHQFEFMKSLGVTSDTYFLDVACGSLRLGRKIIPFLKKGRYFGIEQHGALVEAGLAHEISADIVAKKEPRFFINSNFDLEDLSGINVAWANSLFSHLVPSDIIKCLQSVEKAMADDGVFYATFFEGRKTRFTSLFGSHSRVGFLYPASDMMKLGEKAGLKPEFIGDIGHSRGQKLMAFRKGR